MSFRDDGEILEIFVIPQNQSISNKNAKEKDRIKQCSN